MMIRLWWHGHHLPVTNHIHVAPSSGRNITSLSISQGRSLEFCSGGASHWRRQISNISYFAQKSFWCHWSISGLLQQDMTLNIFYQSASIILTKSRKRLLSQLLQIF